MAAETGDPDSLLSLYRSLIHFRNGSAALRFGDLLTVETGNDGVAAYLRSAGDDHVLVVVNLTGEPVADYALSLAEGPLAGVTRVEAVSGTGPAAGILGITATGGLVAFRPLEELPPFAALVLHLTGD